MRKTLFATTALAAATGLTAIASPASAAERLSLGIGGYFQAYYGFFDSDEDAGAQSTRSNDFFREAEVHFRGEVALDNGMKVGVNVELEAETCDDQIDESYLYFQGDFGKLVLGSENSAAYLMSYGAPAAFSSIDGADPNYYPFGTPTATTVVGPQFNYAPNMTTDSEKVSYFSPRFGGFGFGLSYTPDNTEDVAGAFIPSRDKDGAGLSPYFGGNAFDEVVEAAINFEQKWGSFGVLAGATYGHSFSTESAAVVTPGGVIGTEKRDQVSAGLNLTYSGFTVGAGYLWDDLGLQGNNDRTVWAFGGAWANGPLRIGASVALNDNNNTTENTTRYSLGTSYVYAPGMTANAGVFYWDTDSVPQYENTMAVIVGTAVSF